MTHSTKTIRAVALAAALAVLIPLLPCRPAHAATTAADGWRALWDNHNSQARAAFKAALQANPKDNGALRGLGWLARQDDDGATALKQWSSAIQNQPGHWSATALWPEVVDIADDTGRTDVLTATARALLASKATPALKASARLALAEAAFEAGKPAAAEKIWTSLGYIRAWNVIGPFDNVSSSGFHKAFPPEQAIDFKATYIGKDDQSVRWRRLALIDREGACEVGSSLGDHEPDVYYAATAVYADRQQSVVMCLDTLGASKLYVNQKQVLADPIVRPSVSYSADTFQVPVTLQAGWNTVLVKLADNDTETSAFSLRLTTPEGADMPSVRADPAHAAPAGVAASENETAGQDIGAELAAVALIRKAAPDDPEAAAAVVEILRSASDYTASADAARAALAHTPQSGWLHWELSQTLQSDGQTDESRAERDAALKAIPTLVQARVDVLDDQKEALTPSDMVKKLKALLAINPHSEQVLWQLYSAYDKLKMKKEALGAVRAAVKEVGGSGRQLLLVRVLEDYERSAEARKVLKQAIAADPGHPGLLNKQAEDLQSQGNAAGAIAIYQRLAQSNWPKISYYTDLADIYTSLDKQADAARTLRAAQQMRPQDGTICARLADIERTMGHKKVALELLRTAILLDPANVELREERQALSGEKPVSDLAAATPSAPILAKVKDLKSDGESAIILLDEGRKVVYPDYASVSHYHQIIKVFDQAGVDRYDSYSAEPSSASENVTIERSRLIKADGTVQDNTDTASDGGVAFPSLAPGDTIDVALRSEEYRRGGLAHEFWGHWGFDTGEAKVLQSRFVLITPVNMTYNTVMHGTAPEPSVHDQGSWRLREWRMKDIPSTKAEVLSPTRQDIGTWLDYSSVESWSDIVRWYLDLSGPRCIPDTAVRAKALELTKDAKTDMEKVKATVRFVRGLQYQSTPFRLSAFVPTEGKQVLRERYGDCKDKAALLTALLAAVGIKSEMALLSTRESGVTPFLPSPRFTHAIALVQTPDGPLWVDGTADDMAFRDLPYADQQVPALLIDAATTGLTLTPAMPAESNVLAIAHNTSLAADGVLHGSVSVSAGGNFGWLWRSAFKQLPVNRTDDALRSFSGAMIGQSTYESGGIDNIADQELPVTLRFAYHAEGYTTQAGSFLLAKMPWAAAMSLRRMTAADVSPTRKYPMETASSRGRFEETLRLELPEGYVPQEDLPTVKKDTSIGSFEITYHLDGRTLTAVMRQTYSAFRVEPANFADFMAFRKEFVKEMDRQIVLKKKE
jgi:tetratricopeptide (TPR) repeat protein